MKARLITLVTVAICALGFATPLEPLLAARDTIHVKPGQDAIRNAHKDAGKGTKIILERGIYNEQVEITKDGISLVGEPGATIVPPLDFVDNNCSSVAAKAVTFNQIAPTSHVGICVCGQGIILDTDAGLSIVDYVKGVSIKGLTVRDFPVNVLVIGARGTEVKGNTLINGDRYGFLADGSIETTIKENQITSNTLRQFIALCMDDVSDSNVVENPISGYSLAFRAQADGSVWRRNVVTSCCQGMTIEPKVQGVEVIDNSITQAKDPRQCGFVTFGLFVDGASNSDIRGNTITDHQGFPGGIWLLDDLCPGSPDRGSLNCQTVPGLSIAAGNAFTKNTVLRNKVDFSVQPEDGVGAPNVYKNNKCDTASQPGICTGALGG